MYLPHLFEVTDRSALVAFMREHAFATVIAVREGVPEIGHLPLLIDVDGERVRIRGHIARANPMHASLAAGDALTCVFHGPHAYVSPRHYTNPVNVPTWNYSVVHARGRARIIDDAEAKLRLLRELTAAFESGAPALWTMEQAGDLATTLLPAITAFELEAESLAGKFKLSQNRKHEDWTGVVQAFSRSESAVERAVAELMKRQGPPRGSS